MCQAMEGKARPLDPLVSIFVALSVHRMLTNHSSGRDPWAEAEDLKLLEALAKHGKRWNIISGCIKGRPAVQCRNRFLSLQRAGKVSEDGKSSVSTIAGRNSSSVTDMVKVRITLSQPPGAFH